MIKLIKNLDANELESELNGLGSSFEVLSIYAINQLHFAWVKIVAAEKTAPAMEAKAKRKGN
jgi:hypothetical protein